MDYTFCNLRFLTQKSRPAKIEKENGIKQIGEPIVNNKLCGCVDARLCNLAKIYPSFTADVYRSWSKIWLQPLWLRLKYLIPNRFKNIFYSRIFWGGWQPQTKTKLQFNMCSVEIMTVYMSVLFMSPPRLSCRTYTYNYGVSAYHDYTYSSYDSTVCIPFSSKLNWNL